MKEFTQFEEYPLEIWRRPRQRNMHLTVKPDGKLRVTCHKRLPKREIFAFLLQSREFIQRRFLEIETARQNHPPKQFLSGETFLWRGQRRPLVIVWCFTPKISVRLLGHAFEMKAPLTSTTESRSLSLKSLYLREARKILSERVKFWSVQMGLRPRRLSVRGQNTRWGSCSGAGEISLNWKLMAVPEATMNYVVIHELAHLRHMNHSADFWRLVAQFAADFKSHKEWLRKFESEIRYDWQTS